MDMYELTGTLRACWSQLRSDAYGGQGQTFLRFADGIEQLIEIHRHGEQRRVWSA